jgi:dipeptidyl aminopeptidase/acylaminoacyl peptidase
MKTPAKDKKWRCKKKKITKETPSDGFPFYIFSGDKGQLLQDVNVTEYSISKKGNYVAYIQHQKEKVDSCKLILYNTKERTKKTIISAKTKIQLPVWNETESKMAFLFSSDTAKIKQHQLALVDLLTLNSTIYGDTTDTFFGKNHGISEHRSPLFTKTDQFLYFGKSSRTEPEKKDTLIDSEKPKLDIWHYKDQNIQPNQLINLKRDEKRNQLCLLNLKTNNMIELSNDTLDVEPNSNLHGNYLLGQSNEKYKIEAQWSSPSRSDFYRISTTDGSHEPIINGVYYPGYLSPSGNYFSYFEPDKKEYHLVYLNKKKDVCVSCTEKNTNWVEDINGMPMKAGPIGDVGFTTNEEGFVFRSEFDVWNFDINKETLSCLTDKQGEQTKIRLQPSMWNSDSVYIDFDNLYFKGFNTLSKNESIYQFIEHDGHRDLKQVLGGDFSIQYLNRSKDKSTILLRKSTVSNYPELTLLNLNWENEKVISQTNPQQKDFVWSTVELTKWKSYSGIELEGLIYKPTDFDATKKYPLILYYYELNSDGLYDYHSPRAPGRCPARACSGAHFSGALPLATVRRQAALA